MELKDKHVVVTGAGSGIGRALVQAFAAEGARAVVVADLNAENAEAVAAEIGGTAATIDVSRRDDIERLVEAETERSGPIDLFFSNAGVPGPGGGPEDSEDADWQRTWEINTMAHVWAARAVLPGMLERGEGYIASTASAAGLLAQVGAMAYTVTKHAAVSVAEWLSITYGDAGIKVSCLCPQGVRTPMLDVALEDPVGAAPLVAGGLLEPADVARVVVDGLRQEQFLILPPNLLVWHGDIWLIDHGAALYFHHDWSRADPAKPFDARQHVVKDRATRLADAHARLAPLITRELLREVTGNVPDEWWGERGADAYAGQLLERAPNVAEVIRT